MSRGWLWAEGQGGGGKCRPRPITGHGARKGSKGQSCCSTRRDFSLGVPKPGLQHLGKRHLVSEFSCSPKTHRVNTAPPESMQLPWIGHSAIMTQIEACSTSRTQVYSFPGPLGWTGPPQNCSRSRLRQWPERKPRRSRK